MTPFLCRSCGSADLHPVLDLGATPLANALLEASQLNDPEPVFPLQAVFCPACTLFQITETVPAEKLFSQYFYFSSFSDTVLDHARALADRLANELHLGPQSLVGEVASNDGYLLQNYHARGIPVLGVEPAVNIARHANQRGIRTENVFFHADQARRFRDRGEAADVIHANNVLAHVADLHGVVEGFSLWLKPGGLLVIEVPYVKDLMDHVEFDTIYHEHLCYFSLTALDKLFARHGLQMVQVERLCIHGGSLRIFLRRAESRPDVAASVPGLLEEERRWGVHDANLYSRFGHKVEGLRHSLTTLLKKLKAEGKRIAAYGASAKGSTLLNYFGIGKETLEFLVDRSPIKQGHYAPGSHLRIFAPEKLLTEKPDYVLLLTWNFADEILHQQEAYRRSGGRFIIPIPELRVA